MTQQTTDISVVIATYNRADALRVNFPYVLDLDGVNEIVIVIDGSTDDTEEILATFGDDRVRVVRHTHRRGQVAARKTGIAAARGNWLLMLDDDLAVLPSFATTLLDTAMKCGGDVVGAPWVHLERPGDLEMALAHARTSTSSQIGLYTHPSVFPDRDLETPFMPSPALIRRGVFDRVAHDDKLTGNAYREETSFYLDAWAAGFRCIFTPRTATFQIGQWSGGHRLPRLRYELLVLRNNWRFLRRHVGALRDWGEIRNPVSGQLRFGLQRMLTVGRGYLRARLAGH